VDEAMVDRASRITPQEWRVIALAIEGVAPSQACEALGIALGTLESHKQAIRRKLGIPKGVRFEAYVRENFGEGVPLPEQKVAGQPREPRVVDKATQDRRVRWLLRITLQELSEVSVSAGLRAQLLQQTAQRMNPQAMEEASREVQDLQQIAKEAQALFDRVLADIRARGAEPGSVGQ
jgi:DNA-binding CsgD family transcriptional regulator